MDENTKKAIEAAKKGTKIPVEEVVPTAVVPPKKTTKKKEAVEETPKLFTTPVLKEDEVILGEGGKKVKITEWTGKTRKRLKSLVMSLQGGQEVNFEEFLKILINEHIDKKDIYLSADEQQYLLTRLYQLSISNEVKGNANCPVCGEENEVLIDLPRDVLYTPSKYPLVWEDFPYHGGVEFVDIGTFTELKKTIEGVKKSPNYDGYSDDSDIEIAMHIHFMGASDILTNIGIIDSLPMQAYNEVMQKFFEVSPDFKIVVKNRPCQSCHNTVDFTIPEMPDILTEFMGAS